MSLSLRSREQGFLLVKLLEVSRVICERADSDFFVSLALESIEKLVFSEDRAVAELATELISKSDF